MRRELIAALMATGLELLDDLPRPPAWMAEAACRGMDPELFFPERRSGRPYAAVRVCAACPVSAQCADHALTTDEAHGVWGGLTPAQRKRIRDARAA